MWHRSILETVRQERDRGLCLYGAGFWGKIGFDLFKKLGVTPLCFCDDDTEKQGENYCEIPVYSLKKAVELYPNAIYIPAIDVTKRKGLWNREQYSRMLQNLKKLNVYDSNSELRILMYVFLLDLKQKNGVMSDKKIRYSEINNLLIFNHMSNSGSYYLEQLLDGHPNILSLPYSGQVFWNVYENRLKTLEGEELLYEMMAQMLGYLHSQYENLFCIREHKFEEYCVNQDGEFIYDVLIDPTEFYYRLKEQFEDNIKLNSYAQMLKIYVAAYSNALGKQEETVQKDYWLFYHMHMPEFDVSKLSDYFEKKDFNRIENLFIIREPVQHCFSWIKRVAMVQRRNTMLKKGELFSSVLKSEMGIMLKKHKECDNVKVIRFEDLKYKPEKTMKSLCHWLDIPYRSILLSTTLNGILIYFPTYTKDGVKYITGNDTSAIGKKDFSEVLTLWDEVRLNMICIKFKHAYGYPCTVPDFEQFSRTFQQEMLKENFKFCDIVQQVLDEDGLPEDHYDVNQYVKELYQTYMDTYDDNTEYYDYIKPEADEE